MKRFFLKALYLGVVLGIAGLAGCQNPFDPIREPAAQGKGRVVVTIGDPGTARTIAPAETLFTSYTLTFSGPAQVDPIEVSGVSVKKELELEVGDWTITATGYTGTEGAAVAEGSAAITVSSGETSPVNILLGPKTGGAPGTFSYSLKIPDGLGNGAQLIISRSTGVDLQTISLVYNASGISGSVNLDPGEYLVRVRLQKGGLYAGLTEVLHIYSGLTSTLPLKEYTDNDFRAAVDKGFDLTSLVTKPVSWVKPVTTLADQTQYTGTVAWQNNAGVAFAGATFGENTVYQAVVTLEAKTGYTFTGIAANSFTYTGATVVNVEDSGIVTITFPATAAAPSEPKSNAQHLAMLRNLGVAVDNPDLPIAPNKQPYDPQTSSSTARAATSGSGPSLGPLGKIYSQPQREIFAAGYHEINVSGSVGAKDHVLFE
ncbi:MAG: hypothetical protein LBL76_03760, partial [Treponema sp.]|nr:hypothetical protein [Treponema sp.]